MPVFVSRKKRRRGKVNRERKREDLATTFFQQDLFWQKMRSRGVGKIASDPLPWFWLRNEKSARWNFELSKVSKFPTANFEGKSLSEKQRTKTVPKKAKHEDAKHASSASLVNTANNWCEGDINCQDFVFCVGSDTGWAWKYQCLLNFWPPHTFEYAWRRAVATNWA